MMNRDCRQVREALTRYLDNELADPEVKGIEGHLEACQLCRQELGTLEGLRQLWKEPPLLQSNQADREAIVAAAHRWLEPSGGWIERLRRWITPTDLVTAGAVAGCVVLAVVLVRGSKTSDLPAGWARSSTVLSLAEVRARESGTKIRIDDDLNLIRMS